MYFFSSSCDHMTFIAAPLSTYDGRTSTGYLTLCANSFALVMSANVCQGGCRICMLSSTELNVERFSALSTSTAAVPSIGILFSASSGVRLFAVCPPTHVITPCGDSNSAMSSMRSTVSSSKYNLSLTS